jgi:hypothetical protein
MEANHRWSIRSGKKLIEVGTSWGTPREVLKQVMEEFPLRCRDFDAHYTFEVGDLLASSHGSELTRTAQAMGDDVKEEKLTASGHLFPSPSEEVVPPDPVLREAMREITRRVLEEATRKAVEGVLGLSDLTKKATDAVRKLPTQRDLQQGGPVVSPRTIRDSWRINDKNGQTVAQGDLKHDPEPPVLGKVRILSPEDFDAEEQDRLRELREIERLRRKDAAKVCKPEEHVLSSKRDEQYQGTRFWCSKCQRGYVLSDQVQVLGNFDIETMVREQLSR